MADTDDTKLGGGSLSQRVQQGEKLRPPERDGAEHTRRLQDGTAWREFCRSLERTGESITHQHRLVQLYFTFHGCFQIPLVKP